MHYEIELRDGTIKKGKILDGVHKWAQVDSALTTDGFLLINENEYINLKYVVRITIKQDKTK